MYSDISKHYSESRISFIYVYCFDNGDEYIISFYHNDFKQIDNLYDALDDIDGRNCYVYRYKYLKDILHGSIDAEMVLWYYTNRRVIDSDKKSILSLYNRWYSLISNVVDCIPIMPLICICQDISKQLNGIQNFDITDSGFLLYHNVYLQSLITLEITGIYLDLDAVNQYFRRVNVPEIIYPDINPYTNSGRPVITHRKVSINSLNKNSGERNIFISRFEGGRLIEFDYDSYHLRLIGNMIGYDLPVSNLHRHFGQIYFKTLELSDEQYNQSKRITFKQLYGEITPEFKNIDFFAKVDLYKTLLYDYYCDNGYVTIPVSGRKIYRDWNEDMDKSTLYNYIMQIVETETNSIILGKILHYLYQYQSKLILYTYDSFLIDYNPMDGGDLVRDLQKIIGLQYPVTVSVGKTYDTMVKVTL